MRSLALAILLLALAACGSEKDERGFEVMPDMYHTPAFESQDATTIEVDARDAQGRPVRRRVHVPAMLVPPEGTVARGLVQHHLAATDFAGARQMANPLPQTAAVLKRGQRDYLSFCAPCHGRDGDAANGYVAAWFSGVPSLNGLAMLQMPEGETYHIVTMGRGRMPSFGAQLEPEARWAVARFVRLQALASITAEDVAKLVPQIEAELAKNPNDVSLQARREAVLRIVAEAQATLAAIGSAGDGHEFIPPPPPVPEYIGPTWPLPEGAP